MPTYKQKLAASKLVENGGNIGNAMVEAGYSPATAKTPQKLTTSKGWHELMEEVFPDDNLTKRHRQLLSAKKAIRVGDKVTFVPDNMTRIKALDLAYKLKGYYGQEGHSDQSSSSFKGWTPYEIEHYAKTGVRPSRFKKVNPDF